MYEATCSGSRTIVFKIKRYHFIVRASNDILMINDLLKEIEAVRAKLAALESTHETELKKELKALPSHYGFATTKAFAKAVKAAAGGHSPGAKGAGKTRRTRVRITDAIRADVKRLVAADKTGAEIARALGISLPSVQNVKKALGLVKKRKK